jgi:F0F1-type ATP synthase assembly protein I
MKEIETVRKNKFIVALIVGILLGSILGSLTTIIFVNKPLATTFQS